MTYTYFVGIDVSKKKLDMCVWSGTRAFLEQEISNDKASITAFLKRLSGEGIDLSKTLFCCEHTGLYCCPLANVLAKYDLWMENPLHLNRSIGLQRGKNDKIDAKRIAEYSMRYQDKARLHLEKTESEDILKALEKLRQRLTKVKVLIEVPLNEAKDFASKSAYDAMKKSSELVLREVEFQLKTIEKQIIAIVNESAHTKWLFDLITSVPGIGAVTATAFILNTQCFTLFDDPKKFACYSGVVPFEHTSGSSIRGRKKISKFANTDMRRLLTLCVWSTLRSDNEFTEYYRRKTGEGKENMLVVNALRNKLIHVVFAVVRNNTPYIRNYRNLLASA